MMDVSQTIMQYILKLYSAVCQLHLNKTGKGGEVTDAYKCALQTAQLVTSIIVPIQGNIT